MYNVGQQVYVLFPIQQSQLQGAWIRMYPITEYLNGATYLHSLGEWGRWQKAIYVIILKAHYFTQLI